MDVSDLHQILAIVVLCMFSLATGVASEVTDRTIRLYVSASGCDGGDGTKSKPFATLERARDAVRAFKKDKGGRLVRNVEIIIDGEISILQPLTLEKIDSGNRQYTVTYKATKGSRIVGGPVVSRFQPVSDPDIVAMLHESARGNVILANLRALGVTDFGSPLGGGVEVFFNEKPLTLARWPNEGFTKIAAVMKNKPVDVRGTKGDAVGHIVYEGDRPSRWVEEKDPCVHGYWFWDWSDQRHQIESIDPENKLIRIQPPYHSYGYRQGQWFYAYNLLSEIDSPGEWYLDRSDGTFYFWPPSDPQKARVVVSAVDTAIRLDGVSHVRFEGLQVEATRQDAIVISNSSQVLVRGCVVKNTGGLGIRVDGGRECTVADCEVYNTGRGGISIGGGDRIKLIPANHEVVRCRVHNYGRIARTYSAGVHVSGVGNRVANCEIHDAPHQAIGFSGNQHVFEYNEIYRVCTESNDAGAIYSGRDWTMLDNIVRFNYFHDITGFENKGCVGVYLDDFFSGTTVYGNVFKNVSRAAMVGGGNYNTIENNLFIDCEPCIHLDARGEGWAKDFFDGTSTTLIDRMKAVDYKSKHYSKYAWLQTAMDEPNPGHPRGNKFNRNVGIGGRWADIEDKARPGNEFEDNTVTNDRTLLTKNPKTGIPDLTSEAYQKTGLKPIPTGKIGLGRADDKSQP